VLRDSSQTYGACLRSDLLLATRSKDVISTDGEERSSLVDSLVGGSGDKFTFEVLAASAQGWQVDFASCSAKKGGDELDAVRNFVVR
jgi:hypothetical protein